MLGGMSFISMPRTPYLDQRVGGVLQESLEKRAHTHTVWIAHRGIILAVSPEHLAFADDHEVQNWSVVGSEVELLDTQPAAGGNTFVDLRQQPKPSREGYEPEAGELEDLPRPLLDQPMPQADEELYEPTDPGDHLEAPPVAEEPLAPSLKRGS